MKNKAKKSLMNLFIDDMKDNVECINRYKSFVRDMNFASKRMDELQKENNTIAQFKGGMQNRICEILNDDKEDIQYAYSRAKEIKLIDKRIEANQDEINRRYKEFIDNKHLIDKYEVSHGHTMFTWWKVLHHTGEIKMTFLEFREHYKEHYYETYKTL